MLYRIKGQFVECSSNEQVARPILFLIGSLRPVWSEPNAARPGCFRCTNTRSVPAVLESVSGACTPAAASTAVHTSPGRPPCTPIRSCRAFFGTAPSHASDYCADGLPCPTKSMAALSALLYPPQSYRLPNALLNR